METVPSLCATGTIGVAAIGLAFGRPQHSSTTKQPKSKRRMTSKASLDFKRVFDRSPATPPPQSTSAPATTSRPEDLFHTPISDDTDIHLPYGSRTSMPRNSIQSTRQQILPHEATIDMPRTSRGRKSFQFDFRHTENIKPSPTGLKLAKSSSRDASPALTSLPGSSTLSQSNSSTAAILPSYNRMGTNLSSRNKLVKRSSSQRLLNGHQDTFSTLRRPATSHQRSATMQRQYLDSEEPRPTVSQSSTGRDSSQISNEVTEIATDWRPFFEPSTSRASKSGSTKRKLPSTSSPFEAPSTLFPDLNDLPTLLLASSVESSASSSGRWTPGPSQQGTGSVPKALLREESATCGSKKQSSEPFAERPRTSFSLSDVFPSPSPLKWKMPRTASFRNKQVLEEHRGNKRVVSEPVPAEHYDHYSDPNKTRKLGNHTSIYAMPQPGRSRPRSAGKNAANFYRPSSSPLPPLNRLSSFRLNLPETIPSYPTTPGRKESPPPVRTNPSQGSPDSPLSNLPRRQRDIAPSGTQSDHASTLLGSDAGNSRILSSDDEYTDGPSSTVYDSLRSAATLNSTTSHKIPKIDAIFDKTLPDLPRSASGGPVDLPFERLSLAPTKQDERAAYDGDEPNSMLAAEVAPSSSNEARQGMAKLSGVPLPEIKMPYQPVGSESDLGQGSTLATQMEHDLQKDSGLTNDILSKESMTEHSDDQDAGELMSWRSSLRRRESPPSVSARPNPFAWSEKSSSERVASRGDQLRPKTVQGKQAQDIRIHRSNSRRGPTPVHLRSQSVPVPTENRSYANSSNLDPRALGKHGPSEDWDGDFDFDEAPKLPKPAAEGMRLSHSSAMLVPKSILDNQATVHGQFGQVKELTKLVEELKRLQQQGKAYGITKGQATELWKEAEGIVNLATIDDDDDEHQDMVPSSPPSTDFDFSDDDSPSKVAKRGDSRSDRSMRTPTEATPDRSTSSSLRDGPAALATPPSGAPSRHESSSKAKTVLEHIYHQRPSAEHSSLHDRTAQRKLPFDTTSLKDLVTRSGVVTRALKEEIRRHENRSASPATLTNVQPEQRPRTPPDPPFSQVFQKPSSQTTYSKSPRLPQSPKSPKSPKSRPSSVLGGTMSGNDNDINSHMKVMTVV